MFKSYFFFSFLGQGGNFLKQNEVSLGQMEGNRLHIAGYKLKELIIVPKGGAAGNAMNSKTS